MKMKFLARVILSLMVSYSAMVFADETVDAAEETREAQWLVIHAGNVIAVPGEEPRTEQTIVVKDGRIATVTQGYLDSAQATGGESQAAEILDLKDAYVLPGLMDMHVHLSFEFEVEGQANYGGADEYLQQHASAKDDAYGFVSAIDNAKKTLNAGYTTVRNVGSTGWHIFALRDAIRDGNLAGPRILTAGHAIRIGADSGSGACVSVESCRRATRAQIDMGADVIKVYATCSGSKPCGYQTAPSVFLKDELKAIVDTAGTREIKVAAHAHGTPGINLAASLGVSSIEHGSYNDKESHSIMKRNGVYLVPTLAVQDNIRKDITDAKGKMLDIMQNFLDKHGPGVLAAHKAGVRIAAGSDAGVTVHGNNARELEFYVENGLTPAEAIVTATVNAADLIGMESDLGTLEAGKIADIIAVSGNPLENVSVLKDVAVVIQDGNVVKDAR